MMTLDTRPTFRRRHTERTRLSRSRCLSWVAAAAAFATTSCTGVQSALAPSGREADRIASLFWWMTGGALVVWVFVVAGASI